MQVRELKAAMARKGFSQRLLAEKAKINRSTLANKLSGRRSFDVEEAQRICTALEITDPKEKAFIFFESDAPKMERAD